MAIINDLYYQIAAASSDIHFIYSVEFKEFRFVNHAFEQVWGVPSSGILHDPGKLLGNIREEDRAHVVANYHDFLHRPDVRKLEFRIIVENKDEKYVRLTVFPIEEDGKVATVAGVIEDVSVIKRNIFYSEKINARKDSVLEILSHDLKGPLGTISMLASNIRREVAVAGSESLRKTVQFIQDMCQRNIDLIRGLVEQEFLESVDVGIRKERADIVWEIQDFVQYYKNSESVINKTFVLTSSHPKIYIHIDSLKLMQVVNNLISNAIKFTHDGGVITINVQDSDNHVLLSIADNGIGIPKAVQPYLFEKFTKARRRGLNGEDTVGLGMSIIETIVNLHQGNIKFESEEGVGTTFYIQLPKN